jgi:hypothetical protein
MSLYVMPEAVFGSPAFPLGWPEMNWLAELPRNTYFALWVNLPSGNKNPISLPKGHPLYVITFHQEHFDFEWIMQEVAKIDAPVIILNDGSCYNTPLPSNVYFYNYHSWHHHLDTIMQWHPNRQPRNIKYKVSNICNRVSQSKMFVFTALIENLNRSDLLIKLGDWVEDKNVHGWRPTGVNELDDLMHIFKTKYLGTTISIDDFNYDTDKLQSVNSNPWQPTYLEAALHFASESYHYSLMHNDYGKIIMPGPQFSEKTWKCLIAGTPFIPVGQFESYKYFQDLGLIFDYGSIDLSWDNDPGNLTRLTKIVSMIKSLKDYSIDDIVSMTKNSTDHNTDYIWSGDFYRRCQHHNKSTAEEIINKFR